MAESLLGGQHPVLEDAPWVRRSLIGIAVGFLFLVLGLPLAIVFQQALSQGLGPFFEAFRDPDAIAAIKLTLLLALIAVPLNTVFGVAAAWALARFQFRGRRLLITLIDLPFAVSPVVVGLALVMLYGKFKPFGAWLDAHDIKVIFALPGMVLATVFITFPFVAKEVLHHLEAQPIDAEEAAYSLGAGAWTTFWRVTLPSIRWSLLYGVLLCNARAMGEFGAVSVVSGHIRGLTNTLPLHVEIVYNEYNFQAAFAVASLLSLLGLLTLVLKTLVEWQQTRKREGG
jgi:sulfate transport system permease protein